MELYTEGTSRTKEDVSANVVFTGVIANGVTVTAEEEGYRYLTAVEIKLPTSIPDNSYIAVRSYTELNGTRHYDDAVQIVLTNDGYYFSRDGVICENDFDGLTALPDNWKKVGDSTSTVALSEKGAAAITSTLATRTEYYLNEFVGYDYITQIDITPTVAMDSRRYFGLVTRYQSANSFIIAAARLDGEGWIQTWNGSSWGSIAKFNLSDHGITLELGKTYTYTTICSGDYIAFFIDGILLAEGTIPEGYEKGTTGISTSGVSLEIDDVIIKEASNTDVNYLLYSENFDNLSSLPSVWERYKPACRSYTNNFSMELIETDAETGNKAIAISDLDSSMTVLRLNKDFLYDDFVYEIDFYMTEQSTASNVSYYMGPVFGLQTDGRCGFSAVYVTNGKTVSQAWLTNSYTNPATNGHWITFGSASAYGTTALNTKYTFRMVMRDGVLTYYINDKNMGVCEITDEMFLSGQFGIMFRSSKIMIDNVRISRMAEELKMSSNNSTGTRLRVATFNIGDFSTYGDSAGLEIAKGNGTETTKVKYKAAFEKVGADVWGLQEDSPYFNGNTEESPDAAIYSSVLPYYERKFTGTYNGKAFLSCYELYDVEQVYYPAAVTSYAPEGTTDYGHKWFLTGKIMVEGKEISLVSLHFDWSCRERRAQQIASVIEYAKSQKYCIIIGDFNPEDYIKGKPEEEEGGVPGGQKIIGRINPDSVNIYQEDWAKFTNAGFDTANGGKFGTFGTLMKGGIVKNPYPWDNIFVTPNIKILNAEPVYESWMNDHAIVVADLEIN